MDTRALQRLSLVIGVLVLIASVVTVRRVHTEERGMEFLLVAGMAIGGFLMISGLVGVLAEQPVSDEEEEATLAEQRVASGRPLSVTTAIGLYLLLLSVVAGIVVGVAARDTGAGIQTFTFGLILGGVIYGIGLLLGHRPVEE